MRASNVYQKMQIDHQDKIIGHLPLVHRVATHLKVRLPDFIELEDLEQMGIIGLIEAAKNFDPGRGVAFETFARPRIRGAILDGLRRQSDLPRSAITGLRQHSQAQQKLAQDLGRDPSQAELAAELGLSIDTFHKERTHQHQLQLVSAEEVATELEAVHSEHASDNPEQVVETLQIQERVAALIAELPERDQLILALYYVEELNLKEIGAIIGVSESRVSQILSANANALRKRFMG